MAGRPPTARARQQQAPTSRNTRSFPRQGTASQRGYTAEWSRAAKRHLDEHPLCRYCETGAFAPARVTAATLVDHFYPHRGDKTVFWDRRWWVSSCLTCHVGPKQKLEARSRAHLDALAQTIGLITT